MRVAFISLFKPGLGGGEGRVAHELARHFAARHDAVLICPADRTGLYREDSGLKVFGIQSAGAGEFHIPALSGKTVRGMFDFLDAFSPDIVHAHEPTLMGLIGQIWAKMNLVPFVHTSHVLPAKVLDFGATDALDIKLLQGTLGESVTRRALTDFYDNCDAIIALNLPALTAFRQFGYYGKAFVIPNGRDLARYRGCAPADVDAAEKTLSFIGYISERKNQAYLIDALQHLPDHYKLHLIGKPLNPDYGRHLREYCEARGLSNVIFAGQVPHEEVPSQLESTHVFVSASKMEVQSLVVLEALASGTPVVGLSNETTIELVDDKVGHLLPKDAPPKEFAACVDRICNLPQSQYDELSRCARDRVSPFDWSNVIDQALTAYRELAENRQSITKVEGAVLADLVSFLPAGEVREILKARIASVRREPGPIVSFLMGLSLGQRWRALKRVPGSTWLLAGATILASLIGYLFVKGQGRRGK
ncbi:MAG: glycosyltransferase [Anaerolineae bacterium]|jgi:glycosyltransferase involved in cell wall biosynthesis